MKISIHPFSIYTTAILILFGLMSCGDIHQELQLNKDGSGSLETTLDIGELLGIAKSFETMGAAQDTFSDDTIPALIDTTPAPPKDAMGLLIEKITDPLHDQDFDTTMSYLSMMHDSVRQKETRPDLAERMFVRMKSPANSGDLTMGIIMKFDNSKQLREIINHMAELDQGTNALSQASPLTMESETFMTFDADMKEGWIRFDTVLYTGFSAQLGMSTDTSMSGEEAGMMEMMFGNSKIKSVIHVPGEVISCSNPEAILTKDNKVIIEYPMMDVIRNGKIDGYTILFKP